MHSMTSFDLGEQDPDSLVRRLASVFRDGALEAFRIGEGVDAPLGVLRLQGVQQVPGVDHLLEDGVDVVRCLHTQ